MLPAVAKTAAALVGRVGGLAFGLGIGAAVWTGLAAPACAESSDTAGSRATSAAQPARASVKAAAVTKGPKVGASRPSAGAPRPGTAGAAQPAAAVAAATQVPAANPMRRIAPKTSASAPVVGTRATAAAQASSSADSPRMGLIATWISNTFNLDPRGKLITIYKATHFAIPNNFGFFVQQVSGTGTFTNDSVYDLGDSDQYDWNKFTGIAFTPLEPDRDSVMVGWRYNLTTKEFEIAPFYNVNKERILPNENPSSPGYEVISVPAGESFTYNVDYAGVTISYGGRTVFKPFPSGLTANVWTAARVSGWFGGNESAPRTLSYFIKFN